LQIEPSEFLPIPTPVAALWWHIEVGWV